MQKMRRMLSLSKEDLENIKAARTPQKSVIEFFLEEVKKEKLIKL